MSDTAEDAAEPPAAEPFAGAVVDQAPSTPALGDRVRAVGEIVLCSSVPTQTAIAVVLNLAGWQLVEPNGQFSLPYVLTLSLSDMLLLIVLMIALTRAHGESPTELWIGRRPLTTEILLGLVLVPVVFTLVVVLLNSIRLFAPWLHNVATNPLEQLAGTSASDAALFAIVAIFAGGVREELQRAFLLRRFEHLGGQTVGVVVLSIAFGLAHAVQGRDAVITTGTLGLFWAVIYLRRRSSIAPIISHAGFNSLEILRVALTGTR